MATGNHKWHQVNHMVNRLCNNSSNRHHTDSQYLHKVSANNPCPSSNSSRRPNNNNNNNNSNNNFDDFLEIIRLCICLFLFFNNTTPTKQTNKQKTSNDIQLIFV